MDLIKLKQEIEALALKIPADTLECLSQIKSISTDDYFSYSTQVNKIVDTFLAPINRLLDRTDTDSLYLRMNKARDICSEKRHFENYSEFHSDLYDLILDFLDLITLEMNKISTPLIDLVCCNSSNYKDLYNKVLSQI